MNRETSDRVLIAAPGTERPHRYRPKLRYELFGCGLHGHELLGTDAAELRPEDGLFAREAGGVRWYRCLRCDSWVALSPPDRPERAEHERDTGWAPIERATPALAASAPMLDKPRP